MDVRACVCLMGVCVCVYVFCLQCRLNLRERSVPEDIAQFKTSFHIGNKVVGSILGAHKFTTIMRYFSFKHAL